MKKLLSVGVIASFLIAGSIYAESLGTIELTDVASASSGSGFGALLGLLVPIFIYLFYSYCQFILMKKLNVEGAILSWIPILSIIPLLRSAGMSAWWILGLFVPFLNIYVIIKMLHNGVSLRTGHGAGWTVGLIFLGAIMFPITALTYNPTNQIKDQSKEKEIYQNTTIEKKSKESESIIHFEGNIFLPIIGSIIVIFVIIMLL